MSEPRMAVSMLPHPRKLIAAGLLLAMAAGMLTFWQRKSLHEAELESYLYYWGAKETGDLGKAGVVVKLPRMEWPKLEQKILEVGPDALPYYLEVVADFDSSYLARMHVGLREMVMHDVLKKGAYGSTPAAYRFIGAKMAIHLLAEKHAATIERLAYLCTNSPSHQVAALKQLGWLEKGRDSFLGMMTNSNPQVRRITITEVDTSRLNQVDLLRQVKILLNDPDPAVRSAATNRYNHLIHANP